MFGSGFGQRSLRGGEEEQGTIKSVVTEWKWCIIGVGRGRNAVSETQFYISVAVMPVTTIIIVLIGVLLNNANLNHRLGDFNNRFLDFNKRLDDFNNRFADMNQRLDDTKELLRAEMAKGHSELLAKFAELDTRLGRIESHLNLR